MSITFNGTTQRAIIVQVPSSAAFLVAGWFRRNSDSGAEESWLSIDDGTAGESISLRVFSDDNIYGWFGAGSGPPLLAPGAGNWVFMSYRFSGDTRIVRHLVDGATDWQSTHSTTGLAPRAFTALNIGARFGSGTAEQFAPVTCGMLKVWSGTLPTDAEVLAARLTTGPTVTTGQWARHDFLSGALGTDRTGLGRTLTLIGAPTFTADKPDDLAIAGGATPMVSTLFPSSGPVGTVVTATGTALAGTSAVSINGTPGTDIASNTDTGFTFVVGAGTTTGALALTATAGSLTGGPVFTVTAAPVFTSIVIVTNANTDYTPGVVLSNIVVEKRDQFNVATTLGPTTATISEILDTVDSYGNSLTLTGTTTRTFSGAQATFNDIVPTISQTFASILPTSGATGTSITGTGTNLLGATGARTANSLNLTSFTVVNSTTWTGVIPAGATTGAITLLHPYGNIVGPTFTVASAPVANALRFVALPDPIIAGTTYELQVEAIDTTLADIRVTSFTGNITIGIDIAVPVGFVISSGTLTRAAVAGLATFPGIVFAESALLPVFNGLAPISGLVGTVVTGSGSGITGATGARTFNSIPLTSFSVINDTTWQGTIPAGANGGFLTLLHPNGNVQGPAFTVIPPVIPPQEPLVIDTRVVRFTTVPANQTSNVNFTTELVGEVVNRNDVRETSYVTPVALVMQNGDGAVIGAAVVTPVAGVFTFPANSVGVRLINTTSAAVRVGIRNIDGASAPIQVAVPAPAASTIVAYQRVPTGLDIVLGITGPVAGGTLFMEASFNEVDWFAFDVTAYAGGAAANSFTAAFNGWAESNGVRAVRLRRSVVGVTFGGIVLNVAGL
jgi:hypothetical protein